MDVGGIVIGVSGIEGTVGGGAGIGCDCGIGCNPGPLIFLLAPALPCPFQGWNGGILL